MKTDSLNRSFDEARYRLTREIRENPLLCIGLAVGVGAVIGALGSRAATTHPGGTRWLAELGDEATKLRSGATRAGRHAGKELQAVLHHAADAAPDVDLDHLVRRGRRWLRSVLG